MAIDPQLRALQLIFIEEAKDLLDNAEETLLELENVGYKVELVNNAFRLAHNFKGSSRSIGYSELGKLAHKYEDILTAISRDKETLTPQLITALLRCNDALRREVLQLHKNPDYQVVIDKDLAELSSYELASGLVIDHSSQDSDEDLTQGFGFFEETESPAVHASKAERATAHIPPPESDESLKIPSKRLDMLLNIIGELVVNQSIIDDCMARKETASEMAERAIGYMSKLISDIQNLSLSLRLVPIKPLFQKLRRTARDIADSLGKEIHFIEEGDYCELDKRVIDRIADPLNHMIRNSVDHGVDTKQERMKLGKKPIATVRLTALTQDEQVKIIISDDGRGLNKDKILKRALANGLIKANSNPTETEIFALIFAPGFSTREEITEVSGRGVGMEVVQKAVNDLKGTIKITSVPDQGTQFEIILPLSLSIIGGIVVQANGQRFIVPVSQLVETIELSKHTIETITGTGQVLNLRGEILPIYNLADMLTRKRKIRSTNPNVTAEDAHQPRPALVTQYRGKKVSIEVDRILNQQKVVVKRLGKEFEGLPGIVAGTILSNGEPGLVLSLEKLVEGFA